MTLHQTICDLRDYIEGLVLMGGPGVSLALEDIEASVRVLEEEIRLTLPRCDHCKQHFYNTEFCRDCNLLCCSSCFDHYHNPHQTIAQQRAEYEANVQ